MSSLEKNSVDLLGGRLTYASGVGLGVRADAASSAKNSFAKALDGLRKAQATPSERIADHKRLLSMVDKLEVDKATKDSIKLGHNMAYAQRELQRDLSKTKMFIDMMNALSQAVQSLKTLGQGG